MAETTASPETPAWEGTNHVEDLEQRVQKLEDVVAAICDTQALEDKVFQRVTARLSAVPTAPVAGHALTHDELPPHPSEVEIAPPKPPVASFAPVPVPPQGFAWFTELSLLGEMWWEVRALSRMIRDPLYRVSWLCRIVPIAALLYVTVWGWIVSYQGWTIPVIGMLDDLLVMYLGFKVLGRELRRYRQHEARYGRQ
jgi:hypothetical protein